MKEELITKIKSFGEFTQGEAEAIASAYEYDDGCYIEAVMDLAIGWGVPTREAVRRIVEHIYQ